MPEEDTRNVIDEFKGKSVEVIVAELDKRGVELEIAIENTLRDFNMGTIVRSANAFGVRHVHVIGRRQWNKRGAMMTDKYVNIHYHPSIEAFVQHVRVSDKVLFAVDNIEDSRPLSQVSLPKNLVMLFGQEGPGITPELAKAADEIVAIEQLGSTRSVNVGVAAGVAMYEWLRTHYLNR